MATTQKLQMPLTDALGFVARWLQEHGEPEFAGVVLQAIPPVAAYPSLVALPPEHDWPDLRKHAEELAACKESPLMVRLARALLSLLKQHPAAGASNPTA